MLTWHTQLGYVGGLKSEFALRCHKSIRRLLCIVLILLGGALGCQEHTPQPKDALYTFSERIIYPYEVGQYDAQSGAQYIYRAHRDMLEKLYTQSDAWQPSQRGARVCRIKLASHVKIPLLHRFKIAITLPFHTHKRDMFAPLIDGEAYVAFHSASLPEGQPLKIVAYSRGIIFSEHIGVVEEPIQAHQPFEFEHDNFTLSCKTLEPNMMTPVVERMEKDYLQALQHISTHKFEPSLYRSLGCPEQNVLMKPASILWSMSQLLGRDHPKVLENLAKGQKFESYWQDQVLEFVHNAASFSSKDDMMDKRLEVSVASHQCNVLTTTHYHYDYLPIERSKTEQFDCFVKIRLLNQSSDTLSEQIKMPQTSRVMCADATIVTSQLDGPPPNSRHSLATFARLHSPNHSSSEHKKAEASIGPGEERVFYYFYDYTNYDAQKENSTQASKHWQKGVMLHFISNYQDEKAAKTIALKLPKPTLTSLALDEHDK